LLNSSGTFPARKAFWRETPRSVIIDPEVPDMLCFSARFRRVDPLSEKPEHHLFPSESRTVAGRWLPMVFALTIAGITILGWRTFLFSTDDAYIAFRYVYNLVSGIGLTWNPPPFSPVEGYSSYLWVVLLAAIWKLTGISPVDSANVVSLLFGLGTLTIVAWIFRRTLLPKSHQRARLLFLGLIFAGILTNRTFYTWLSSGLETSLFNFLFTGWIALALFPSESRPVRWTLLFSTSATLLWLTRPEGGLAVAATGLILTVGLFRDRNQIKNLLGALPMALVPIHQLWRLGRYGEWLPNTYVAKHVAPWPEAGAKFAFCFAIEYAVWFWGLLMVGALIRLRLKRGPWLPRLNLSNVNLLAVLTVLLIHLSVFTFDIGGGRFEYRIYSHLIPLLFLTAGWAATRITAKTWLAAALLASFVILSWPVQWIGWAEYRRIDTYRTYMFTPIAQRFPRVIQPVMQRWDAEQHWLIDHFVGTRHQEEKLFFLTKGVEPLDPKSRPQFEGRVLCTQGVGVTGWNNPDAGIIDLHGLNDWTVARNPVDLNFPRQMAHDRNAPESYFGCFCAEPEKRFTKEAIDRCEQLGRSIVEQAGTGK
jgi:arabinofuranosyltransferase